MDRAKEIIRGFCLFLILFFLFYSFLKWDSKKKHEDINESVHIHIEILLSCLILNWQKTERNPVTLILQLSSFLTELPKVNECNPSIDSEV